MRATKTKKPTHPKPSTVSQVESLGELERAHGDAAAVYTRLSQVMQALVPQYLSRLNEQKQQQIRDQGVTGIYGNARANAHAMS